MEVSELVGEDWEDMWEYPYLQLVSTRYRLIQFKILHRIYLIPRRLHKILYIVPLPLYAWRCMGDSAGYLHVLNLPLETGILV